MDGKDPNNGSNIRDSKKVSQTTFALVVIVLIALIGIVSFTLNDQFQTNNAQYGALQTNYTSLQNQYNTLQQNYTALLNGKQAKPLTQLPAGAIYPVGEGLVGGSTSLQILSIAGQGQIATVSPGQSISVSYTIQIIANSNDPGEIRQALFAYSWASSWPPPLSAYTTIYDGSPGLYPGVTMTNSFTITAPTIPGTYYVWFLGASQYSMNTALQLFMTAPSMAPSGEIIVSA
jgi:hypothetical protein